MPIVNQPRLIRNQVSYYKNCIKVYIPFNNFIKGYNSHFCSSRAQLPRPSLNESNLERSIRRSRKMISDYILCNDFDMFVTFTFNQDRLDCDKVKQRMLTWIKNQRKKHGQFKYIFVPEFHSDGKSLHFHALFSGYRGALIPAINPKTNRLIKHNRKQVYSLAEYKSGFTNAQFIEMSSNSQKKVAQYVKKYITKDMPTFSNKHRFWGSKSLKKPIVIDNDNAWFDKLTPDYIVESDEVNGKFLFFNRNNSETVNALLKGFSWD